ncbi:BORG1 protein, partial [Atractosteus spatula]|nr:BORG1 protein [Atractosteus spatula]
MPAKTPMYLKTSTPKRGKKLKLRDILSGDMISPPLGDLRHSAHVGPEGETDMFGDVGFIQGKLDLLPGMSRARSRSAERGRAENSPADKRGQQPAGTAPTLLKNTVSLPVFSPEQAPPKPPRLHLEETPPAQRSMRGLSLDSDAGLSNEDLQSERSASPGVPNSESLLGLDLDLGPSILEDVLRIMDQYKAQDEDYEL